MKKYFGLLLFCSGLSLAQDVPSLSVIPASLANNASLPLATTISFSVESKDASRLAKQLAHWPEINAEVVSDTQLNVTLKNNSVYAGQPKPDMLASSFVIDVDESATRDFIAAFEPQQSQPLTSLQAYVNGYISEPTYVHGFNIASKVATQKSGDCTEYAVLVTALARAHNWPARVIFGAVIVEQEESVAAYGHAWSEVFFNASWHTVDAALHTIDADKRYYLPIGALSNEGPGFAMSIFSTMNIMPSKVQQVRTR